MYVPEYTITSEILKNIATIEYGKAIIDSQKILPHWKKQISKEAKVRTIRHSLQLEGMNFEEDKVKRAVDGVLKTVPKEIKNFLTALELVETASNTQELDETEIKELHRKLTVGILPETQQGRYRSMKLERSTNPEELLAEMVELFDWYNSLDAKETHPVITSGIMLSQMEKIKPFSSFNPSGAVLTTRVCLKMGNYHMNDYYSLEESFAVSKVAHARALESIEDDLTKWLEYFTDTLAREVSNIKEKVLLLARDTKLAKASGRVNLTERQERIVEFLQDYGLLQNKAFTKLFPDVSEDSILRDLKTLIEMGVVVKRGKTKSSRYELK
ncbi:hypothetical protein HN803_05455 [candidate division WWE3 bacterium]|jgi:Fic family protein|nr:hypothetical protein [candidate division WWE3 bacterium]MBT7350209.1 hypothetical protein [candidate division WWE3 bacterium]